MNSPSSSTTSHDHVMVPNRVIPSDLPFNPNLKTEDSEMHRPLVDKHMPPLISAIGGPGFSRRISQCSTSSNCSGINSPLYEGAELRDMSDGNRPNISAIENKTSSKSMAMSMHLELKAEATPPAPGGEREKEDLHNSFATKEPLCNRSSPPPQNIDGKIRI